ncbi:MAG TPA: ABC transporter ATP-binding protein [Chloroflexota bacterium]
MAHIAIQGLDKSFGNHHVLTNLDLEVHDKEFVTLLGPSGCGKTTTLRLLAGFLKPDRGEIVVDGRVLTSPQMVVPPERRNMGMVFQNYAVWPHMTVFENVAFGLKLKRLGRSEIEARVGKVLAMVGLGGLEGRYPGQLSGGQQQRVALARSLVVEPSILLLDEPLSNLDAKLRERMRIELKDLQRRTGITFVYVTHDQAEALALSDRVAVMYNGVLQQYATPREVYERPANRFVADFMGQVNLLEGTVAEPAEGGGGFGAVVVDGGLTLKALLPQGVRQRDRVAIAVRPEDVALSRERPHEQENVFCVRVAASVFLGNLVDYRLDLDGLSLRVQTARTQRFVEGESLYARLAPEHCLAMV